MPLLTAGDVLELRREPQNPYDKRAIEIWALVDDATLKLGYIARIENEALAALMDEGVPVVGHVLATEERSTDVSRGPWRDVRYRVTGALPAPATPA